jgi:hypothetical protein
MSERQIAAHMAIRPCILVALKRYAELANAADTATTYLEVLYQHLGPSRGSLPTSIRNVKTLVQRIDQFDTLPGDAAVRTSDPTVRRLIAAAAA